MAGGNLKRRRFIVVYLVCLISVGPLAMAQSPLSTGPVVWEYVENPESIDPHVDYQDYGSLIFSNVYETLYTYEWNSPDVNSVIPLLAQDLTISSDLLNYTFTLREVITYQDGTQFNASCVKYNMERVLAIFHENGPAWMLAEPVLGGREVADAVYQYGMGSQEHVTAYNNWLEKAAIIILDTYTVRIRLAYPYAPFIKVLANPVAAMISPSWIERNGGVQIGEENAFLQEHTCGTGPYFVDSWTPDGEIVLQKQNNYWREALGRVTFPYAGAIDEIILRTNEDVNSRILNVQAAETDGCDWPSSHYDLIYNGVTGYSGDGSLKSSNPNLRLWCDEPTLDMMFIGLNLNPTINTSTGIHPNILCNRSVRECFSYAFDYQELIQDDPNGFALQQRGLIPQGLLGYSENQFMYTQNLTLAAAAWNRAMEDGWLDTVLASYDYRLYIDYPDWGPTFRQMSSLALKSGLEEMLADDAYGAIQPSEELTIDTRAIEWSAYVDYLHNNKMLIYHLALVPDFADPDIYIHPFTLSTGFQAARMGLGSSDGWDAPTVDELVNAAASTIDDSEREQIYDDIQTDIIEHVAYIFCYQKTNFHVQHADLLGYVFNPMRDLYFYHMWRIGTTTAIPVYIELAFEGGIISGIILVIGLAIIIDNRTVSKWNDEQTPQNQEKQTTEYGGYDDDRRFG